MKKTQMTVGKPLVHLQHESKLLYRHVHRLQVRIAKAVEKTAGSAKRLLKGLSCLLGNSHGQFLEGWGLGTVPSYSALGWHK